MTTQQPAPSAADINAARLLLARLGVSAADLVAATEQRASAPTFAEYVPVVRAAVANGTRRVYESYWNRIVEQRRPYQGR
jgi:integrase/recombinase XerC